MAYSHDYILVPVEDNSLREMAEYVEANRCERIRQYNNVQCTFNKIVCIYYLTIIHVYKMWNLNGQIRAIHIATLEKTQESSENSLKGVKIFTIFLFFM